MPKVTCQECGKVCKNAEALEMHVGAKHAPSKEEPKKVNTKEVRNWTIFIVIIGVIVLLIGWGISSAVTGSKECKTAPVTEINIGSHTNLAMHIHPHLQIIVNGQQQLTPANIGVGPGLMRPIHTHDSSGEIHVEGPCKREFVLGDFFAIWGRNFDSQCILDNCITDGGTLTMTVNGQLNNEFENLVLKDEDNIVINYDSF
jgi:hypothetical protein